MKKHPRKTMLTWVVSDNAGKTGHEFSFFPQNWQLGRNFHLQGESKRLHSSFFFWISWLQKPGKESLIDSSTELETWLDAIP